MPVRARRYNISFHSRAIEGGGEPLEVLAKVALDTKVDGDASRMLCMERGEVVESGDEYRVQELRQGMERWSYAAENTSLDKLVNVEIQFAEEYSANLPGSKNEQGITYTLKPGETQYLASSKQKCIGHRVTLAPVPPPPKKNFFGF